MTTAPLPNLTIMTPETAAPDAAAIMNAAKAKFGFSPNMYGYMAILPGVLTTYTHGYNSFRADSGFSPLEQEVIFIAISNTNGCHYCTAAHSMIAEHMSGVPADVLANLRAGELPADGKLSALVQLTKALTETRGRPDQSVLEAFLQAGYTQNHVLGIIQAIAVKVMSNYTNYLAQTTLDEPFAPYAV